MGVQALALLAALDTACSSVEDLGQVLGQGLPETSRLCDPHQLPRAGRLDGRPRARRDRRRPCTIRRRPHTKAYAGSAPITRASGKSVSITHRRIKNDRFAAAGWIWALVL